MTPALARQRSVTVFVPLRTISTANAWEHWRARVNRQKREKAAVMMCFMGRPLPELPVVVTLTRRGMKLLDDDNIRPCLKSVRDQVASLLKADDADPRIEWRYEQVRVKRKEIGVEVSIVEKPVKQKIKLPMANHERSFSGTEVG